MEIVTIKLNRATVRDLLRGPEMTFDLLDRANRIAAAAGEGFEAEVSTTSSRAHAQIRTATFPARIAEATDRALTRALDAGR